MSYGDRNSRQLEAFPESAIKTKAKVVAVVGCGAAGVPVARMLAAIGMPKLYLFDGDKVERKNIGNQLHLPAHVGVNKASALNIQCEDFTDRSYPITSNWDLGMLNNYEPDRPKILFLCVDTMEGRRMVLDTYQQWYGVNPDLLIDGRMASEYSEVYAAWNEESYAAYLDSLTTEAAAYTGRCTLRTTAYGAFVEAGIKIGIFRQWLSGLTPPTKVVTNLLAFTMNPTYGVEGQVRNAESD